MKKKKKTFLLLDFMKVKEKAAPFLFLF